MRVAVIKKQGYCYLRSSANFYQLYIVNHKGTYLHSSWHLPSFNQVTPCLISPQCSLLNGHLLQYFDQGTQTVDPIDQKPFVSNLPLQTASRICSVERLLMRKSFKQNGWEPHIHRGGRGKSLGELGDQKALHAFDSSHISPLP